MSKLISGEDVIDWLKVSPIELYSGFVSKGLQPRDNAGRPIFPLNWKLSGVIIPRQPTQEKEAIYAGYCNYFLKNYSFLNDTLSNHYSVHTLPSY